MGENPQSLRHLSLIGSERQIETDNANIPVGPEAPDLPPALPPVKQSQSVSEPDATTLQDQPSDAIDLDEQPESLPPPITVVKPANHTFIRTSSYNLRIGPK